METVATVEECVSRSPSDADGGQACDLLEAAYGTIEDWSRRMIERPCRVRPVFRPQATSDEAMVRALLAIACDVPGRECQAQLRDARAEYEAGRFVEVPRILEPCLAFVASARAAEACPGKGYDAPPSLESALEAYEILAQTYIATNQMEKAETAVHRLVFLDPDYTPTGPFVPEALVRAARAARETPIEPEALGIEDCGADFSLAGVCAELSGQCDISRGVDYGPWEIGIEAGFFLPDEDLSGKSEATDEAEPQVGIRVDYLFGDHWGVVAGFTYSELNSDVSDPTVEDSATLVARGGMQWLAGMHGNRLPRQWYVLFGAGRARYDLEFSASVDRWLAFAGVGQRLLLEPRGRARMRWEIRVDHTLDNQGFGGRDLTSAQLLLGLSWGTRRNPDRNGDGVGTP